MCRKALFSSTVVTVVLMFALDLSGTVALAQSKTVIDEWASVQAPKPPELKPVTVDPKTTAFLILDIIKQSCNNERRPRCIAAVPHVEAFLKQARAKGLTIIYSYTSTSTPADILKEVAPLPGEPLVQAPSDKFFKTDLEKILQDKGIKTVIISGTAAQGAVLYTASSAAFRGFKVVVPVDGMPADNAYFEQYTVYQLANIPGSAQQMTVTKFDLIK